ncbi:hypothetical protein H5410_039399 [Solanum commersonii]|uniref:Uncharacterized protein n=1 Tax=Solanum commersonii TaxID=4109 RepID=A0A9J5XM03_SOLCO|nr:hypothetical protein H5410_039399 [Solanum commersonii]
MENVDGTNGKRIRAEDVICELKYDGAFDKLRLKIRKREVLADCDMTYEACISGAGASCLGERRCRGRLELRFDLQT